MPLRAVLFDMDGVLVETEPIHAAAYVVTFGRFGVQVRPGEYTRAVTLGGSRVHDWFRSLGGVASPQELYAVKDVEFRRLAGESLAPKRGAAELVCTLHNAGIKLALCTSARHSLACVVLAEIGLLERFSTVVGMEDVAHIKPDPEVYLKAAQLLGVTPGEAVVIEDTPNGVLAAKRAGMRAVGVPSLLTAGSDFSNADMLCESLSDLDLRALENLLGRCAGQAEHGG